jgi:hypothetical protein
MSQIGTHLSSLDFSVYPVRNNGPLLYSGVTF